MSQKMQIGTAKFGRNKVKPNGDGLPLPPLDSASLRSASLVVSGPWPSTIF